MESSVVLLITVIIISAAFISGDARIESTRFIIQNNCPYTIWPATAPTGNSPALSKTGFTLIQGFSSTIDAPSDWQGRIWARTLCATNSSGDFFCSVGDCGSGNVSCSGRSGSQPISLVEFALNGFNNMDFYDVSLVDGFNLPVTITPSNSACNASAGCPKDINSVCPWPMAIKNPSDNSSVVACKSACFAFNADSYCCRGEFNTPQKCSQSDYAVVFKSQCPHAYTYAFDQQTNTYTCATGGDYFITFCPAASAQSHYIVPVPQQAFLDSKNPVKNSFLSASSSIVSLIKVKKIVFFELPLSTGLVTMSRRGMDFAKLCDVLLSLLLKEIASLFSLSTHLLVPPPNRVMAAGKHPNGGRLVTPILFTPTPYSACCINRITSFIKMAKQLRILPIVFERLLLLPTSATESPKMQSMGTRGCPFAAQSNNATASRKLKNPIFLSCRKGEFEKRKDEECSIIKGKGTVNTRTLQVCRVIRLKALEIVLRGVFLRDLV
ncbi:LOW QUALITY PROTEIN: hypothetical protein V2J09_010643 [Rumex salicifolius]